MIGATFSQGSIDGETRSSTISLSAIEENEGEQRKDHGSAYAADSNPFDELITLCFDAASYECLFPDLQAAKRDSPALDLKHHFRHHGASEGRQPSPLFDNAYVRYYLARIARVDVDIKDVFLYFANLPKGKRFIPNRFFSPWAFREMYNSRYSNLETLSDYEVFEFYASRCSIAALSPNGVFSEERYRARYPDVAAAIGSGTFRAGFFQFATGPADDERTNLPGRVTSKSGEANWLLGGQVDLTTIVGWFDEIFYLSVYRDVHDMVRAGVAKSGLEHYLTVGFRQGRLPSATLRSAANTTTHVSGWDFIDDAVVAALPAQLLITLEEACEVRRFIEVSKHGRGDVELSEALWPFVLPPSYRGTFDADHYLAVNTDVAKAIGDIPPAAAREAAKTHWCEHGLGEHRVAPGTDLIGERMITYESMANWKSGVNLFGPMSAQSGLGGAARGYASALRAAGIEVDVYDVSKVVDGRLPGCLVSSNELKYSINMFCINADTIQSFVARYGADLFRHRANVAAWVWELMAPRPEWRAVLSAFDLIVTPSRFCSESFALFTDVPVCTIPYVVDLAAFGNLHTQTPSNIWISKIEEYKRAGRRIVLFIMDASSYSTRKGADIYCDLAARISKSHPNRFLFVLKTHARSLSDTQLKIHDESVFVIDSLFTATDIGHLKASADLYVSPHRSEGFGFNMIESILLGVPALVSGFAGGTELLSNYDPKPVPVHLSEIGTTLGPYNANAIWAEPDVGAFEESILSFFDGEGFKTSSNAVRQSLAEQLSPQRIGSQFKEALVKWCAYGAEDASDRLAAFQHVAAPKYREGFFFKYVKEDARRTPEAPGIDRLSEIVMRSSAPFFSIITPTLDTEPRWLHELFSDLLHQSFPSWEWCISDDGSTRPDTLETLKMLRREDARIKLHLASENRGIAAATNAGVAIAIGAYVVMVDHDDRISPHLLATYYNKLQGKESECVIYCDEDKIDTNGLHRETYHKPDWSPEHLVSCMYVLHCLCVRKSVFLRLSGYRSEFDGAQDHDFLLRVAAAHVPIVHVDRLLYHWRMAPGSAAGKTEAKHRGIESGRRAVAAYLDAVNVVGSVEHGLLPGTYRVRPALSETLVSLNILTACTAIPDDQMPGVAGARTFVEQFVRSILAHAPALNFRIRVIVDRHALIKASFLEALDPRISVVPFDRTGLGFNFSEMANFALKTAETDHLVLLNDDMEALDEHWLGALLEPLELPGVGIVGGQLLYADDTVQHCGVALGIYGAAAHLFEGTEKDAVLYNSYNRVMRNYSAVTGAMMAMQRSTFERVRGFDVTFPVDYNDIDFCLKVGEIGLRTVYTPFAQLRHFESRSARRLIADQVDRQRFCKRWSAVIARDPYYNENLTKTGIMCEPGVAALAVRST